MRSARTSEGRVSGDARRAVARPRLIELLPSAGDEGRWSWRRTSVWAAAGAGKSTLAAQWCAAMRLRGVRVLWLSAVSRGLVSRPLAAELDHQRRAGALAGPRLTAVVIDDVELLRDRGERAAVWRALETLPRTATAVLLGRYDPFSRLRGRGSPGLRMEIRGDALSFTEDEARQLFALRGVPVRDQVLADLVRRTEGWVTGLCLCVDELERHPDPDGWVATFTGAEQAVADYLVCEVLDHLEPGVREFLLSTCVVDELPVGLASALSGRADSGAVLDELCRTNRFVHRVTDDGFEYHKLLGSYLRAELGHRDLGRMHGQHVTAARWLEAHGRGGAALSHAVKADDTGLVQQLISREGLRLALSGEGAATAPALALLRNRGAMTASAHLVAAATEIPVIERQADIDHDLAAAEQLLTRQHDGGLELARSALLVVRAEERGSEAVSALSRLERAARRFDAEPDHDTRPEHADVRILSGLARGIGLDMLGHASEAADELVLAGRTATAIGRTLIGLEALDRAARALGTDGRWLQADDLVREIASSGGTQPVVAAYRLLARGWRSYVRCEPLDLVALRRLESAPIGGLEPVAGLLLALADAEADRGSYETLSAVEPVLVRAGGRYPEHVAQAVMRTLTAAARVGGRQRARSVAEEILAATGPDCLEADLVGAVLEVDSPVAFARLRIGIDTRRRSWAATTRVAAWLMLATLAARRGRRVAADEALRSSLEDAMPLHLVRPFVEAGPEVPELLIGARGRLGHLEPFADAVARALASGDSGHEGDGPAAALTSRELTILRDLPSVLTLSEIADVHVISVNTVKTHLRSMYRKLEVSGRAQAVRRARRLGIY